MKKLQLRKTKPDEMQLKLYLEGDQNAYWPLIEKYRNIGILKAKKNNDFKDAEEIYSRATMKVLKTLERIKNDLNEFGEDGLSIKRKNSLDKIMQNFRAYLLTAVGNTGLDFKKEKLKINTLNRNVRVNYMDVSSFDKDGILSLLPKECRVIFDMKVFKDFSVKEISEELNLKYSTVKGRLDRSRKILRRKNLDQYL